MVIVAWPNGMSASGKTSIARALARRLDIPILSLDVVKEQFFDALGNAGGDREFGRILARASINSIWALLVDFPPDALVVVEAWFRLPPHTAVVEGLHRAGIERTVEVWCHAPASVLAQRYADRERHPGHPPAADYVNELVELAGVARPMAIGPHIEVDTCDFDAVDIAGVADWAIQHLGTGRP